MSNSNVVIPPKAKQMYPDLVEMILQSQAMNEQEQNYWLQVLPIMKKDQLIELRNILLEERKKRAEIQEKYAPKPVKEPSPEDLKAWEEKKRQERLQRQRAEAQARQEEDPDDILAQLANL